MPDHHNVPQAPPLSSVSRRRALGSLGATGLAAFVGISPAKAFFGSSAPEVDLNGLPKAWVRRQGRDLERYANFLAGLRLKHVTPRQVIDAHAKRRGGLWNTLPPRRMWKHLKSTLEAVDEVAERLGYPVEEVVSAYRSPAYNRRISGASQSWHKANVAVDVKFPVSAWTVTRTARAMRDRGVFRGGVGSYSSFTHIDTRGHNVDW